MNRPKEVEEQPLPVISSPIENMIVPFSDPPSTLVTRKMLSLATEKAKLGKELLSLGAGSPASVEALEPFKEKLGLIASKIFNHPELWTGYVHPQGLPELRKHLSAYANKNAATDGFFTKDDIVVTNAGQQAIDMLRQALVNPGEAVFTQAPSYIGAIANFESHGVKVAGVKIDEDGMKPDELRSQFEKARKFGLTPKFIYINPAFANPTGENMSAVRKKEIYEVARELDLVIVEDDPCRNMAYPGVVVPPSMAYFDTLYPPEESRVIIIHPFSKEFAPGVQKGFIATKNRNLVERLAGLKTVKDLRSDTVNQRILLNVFEEPRMFEEIVASYARVTYERYQILETALKKYGIAEFFTWKQLQGGLYLYLTAKDSRISIATLQKMLHDDDVEIVPASACFPSENEFNPPPPDNSVRLTFTGLPREKIDEAVKRFSNQVTQQSDTLYTYSIYPQRIIFPT